MNRTPISITVLALVAALALAGCGGGGNGSGNRTLNGTFLDANSAPLAGDTVIYDKDTAGTQTTITDAQGRYRLVIPHAAITGSDTLTFSDPQGHLIDVVTVTIHTDIASTSLTTVAPPSPPTTQL
jgi:hypothetical protein